jgi:hypothetical protein
MSSIKHQGMLAELYVDALIADEKAADEVWQLWDAGVITDEMAAWAWWLLASNALDAIGPRFCGTGQS